MLSPFRAGVPFVALIIKLKLYNNVKHIYLLNLKGLVSQALNVLMTILYDITLLNKNSSVIFMLIITNE